MNLSLGNLGDAMGELVRLLSQGILFPSRYRRATATKQPSASGVASAPAGETTPPADTSQGRLMIMGGRTLPDDLVLEAIHVAGGRGARIVVIPSASLDFTQGGERYARSFRRFGARQVERLDVVTRWSAADESRLAVLDEADLVFLAGGDEGLLLRIVKDTPAEAALVRAHRRGAVVAGIGAGGAVLGGLVAVRQETDGEVFRKESIALEAGLGLFKGVLVDGQLLRSGQGGRLFHAVIGRTENEGILLAVSIDEGAALIVEGDGQGRVAGEGMVAVARGRAGEGGVVMDVLAPGERYDFRRGRRLATDGEPAPRPAFGSPQNG